MERINKNWSQEKYINTFKFVANAHKGQLCKGTDLPYIMHINFVSIEIIFCLEKEDKHNGELAVQCALLHDVLEDTEITYSAIENEFGKQIAKGVLALTKDKSIDKKIRVKESLGRIQQQPFEIWMVKLADRITNLEYPLFFWDKEKRMHYWKESIAIYETLREASAYLSERLFNRISEYKKYL